MQQLLLLLFIVTSAVADVTLDLERDFGAVANDNSPVTCAFNTNMLSSVLKDHPVNASLVLARVNRTIYFHNGIYGSHLRNMRLIVDGTVRFERPPNFHRHRHPASCLQLVNSTNVTLTSSRSDQRGLIDGQGSQYWGVSFIVWQTYMSFHSLYSWCRSQALDIWNWSKIDPVSSK